MPLHVTRGRGLTQENVATAVQAPGLSAPMRASKAGGASPAAGARGGMLHLPSGPHGALAHLAAPGLHPHLRASRGRRLSRQSMRADWRCQIQPGCARGHLLSSAAIQPDPTAVLSPNPQLQPHRTLRRRHRVLGFAQQHAQALLNRLGQPLARLWEGEVRGAGQRARRGAAVLVQACARSAALGAPPLGEEARLPAAAIAQMSTQTHAAPTYFSSSLACSPEAGMFCPRFTSRSTPSASGPGTCGRGGRAGARVEVARGSRKPAGHPRVAHHPAALVALSASARRVGSSSVKTRSQLQVQRAATHLPPLRLVAVGLARLGRVLHVLEGPLGGRLQASAMAAARGLQRTWPVHPVGWPQQRQRLGPALRRLVAHACPNPAPGTPAGTPPCQPGRCPTAAGAAGQPPPAGSGARRVQRLAAPSCRV